MANDAFYYVEPGGLARPCERAHFDEQFDRGARESVNVFSTETQEIVHHFVAAWEPSDQDGVLELGFTIEDDGSLTIRTSAGDQVMGFASYEWVEVAQRFVSNGGARTPAPPA